MEQEKQLHMATGQTANVYYNTLFHPQPHILMKNQKNPCLGYSLYLATAHVGARDKAQGRSSPVYFTTWDPDLDHSLGRGCM